VSTSMPVSSVPHRATTGVPCLWPALSTAAGSFPHGRLGVDAALAREDEAGTFYLLVKFQEVEHGLGSRQHLAVEPRHHACPCPACRPCSWPACRACWHEPRQVACTGFE
jgi:hypothetical protein